MFLPLKWTVGSSMPASPNLALPLSVTTTPRFFGSWWFASESRKTCREPVQHFVLWTSISTVTDSFIRLMASTGDGFIPDSFLRMRFPGLTPICFVELLGAASGDRQGVPLLPGVDSGDLDDLADVVAGVAKGSLQGQRHGMRLPTDQHRLFKVFWLQALERHEQAGPTSLPRLQNFRPAAEG